MTDQDLPFPDNSLAPHEEQRFKSLEDTVSAGLRDFRQTGQALSEIRDNEFYRETHSSFEVYLQDRWGFTPRQAGQLIDAAQVARVLEPIGIDPVSEAQARKFKPAVKVYEELEPEQQRLVSRLIDERRAVETGDVAPWEEAAAPEMKIMATVVKKMTPDTTVYHPESGDEVALGTLSPTQRFEVVREHVNQKTQAYHEKQAAKAAAEPEEKVNWAAWCLNYAREGLTPEQRLEIVLEQGQKGKPVIHARVVDKTTGEVLVEGEAVGNMKKAVLGLITEVRG
ncbi:hypothetical protein [Deinococcus fonticola]|uniref:hypothetical protein n=1 Tax=Deinococcus fonticola TaxID=2528713 RepID=UPI001074CF49|nr:hypothetical protein [Deinococcus fonticola]